MRALFTYLMMMAFVSALAQRGLYINGPEAFFRVDTSAFISVDGDFVNTDCDPVMQVRFNGPLHLSGNLTNHDSLKFVGSTNSSSGRARLYLRTTTTYPAGQNIQIAGTVVPRLWSMVLNKPGGTVTLMSGVRSSDTIEFSAGRILMNGHNWELVDPAGAVSVMNHPWIKNETSASRFTGTSLADTGKVIYSTIYNSSTDFNPANIGIQFLGPVDFGSSVHFERGFKAQQAGKSGAGTFYKVRSPAYSLQNTTVTIRYYATDGQYYTSLNQFQITAVKPYVSADTEVPWTQLLVSATSGQVNSSVTQGFFSMPLSQLSHPNISADGTALRFTVADQGCFLKPASALYYDTLRLCTGKSFTMDAGNLPSVLNSPLRWEWNGTPPSFQQTLAVQAGNTPERFRVRITDVRGCMTNDSVFMPPSTPGPVIAYLNHLNACLGDSVTIKDTVKISGVSYVMSWVFSDGTNTKTTANVFKKKFSSAGQYSLQVTVNSQYGCKAEASITNIMVYPLPTAAFTHSYDCATDLMNFSNTSASNYSAHVVSPSWFFDGSEVDTSTSSTPSVNFETPGSHMVSLRATTTFGCRDSVSGMVTVHPRNVPAFRTENVCFGATSSFTNLSVCNTGSCSYEWINTEGTVGKSYDESLTFDAPGAYGMKLRVTAPVGCADSTSQLLFVHPLPQAQFSLSSPSLCVNHPLYLSNSSSVSAGSITSYSWDFGNGNSSGSVNANTTYSAAGLFKIVLKAVTDSGCVARDSAGFVSLPQPVASFLANNVCSGNITSFTSNSSGNGLTHLWHMNSSTSKNSGTTGNFSYMYPLPGSFQASLVVTDANGCADTASGKVVVRATPSVNLGGTIATCGNSYTLDAMNPNAACLWWPGNTAGPTLVAKKNGMYTVKVTAVNGCEATSSVDLTLHGEVRPNLGKDRQVCGGLTLDAGYPGSQFQWNNGGKGQTLHVSSSGTFVVEVTDQNQCSGADTVVIEVLEVPQVYAGSDTVLCTKASGLELICTGNAAVYQWNTGATGNYVLANVSGYYWVEATGANGCASSDTIKVKLLQTPTVELGPDRASCQSVVLDARNAGCDFLWNTGSNSQWLEVTSSKLISVVVSDSLTGCSDSDSVNVTVFPPVVVNLGNDTTFCSGRPLILNAGNPGSVFSWLNASGSRTLEVSHPGFYGVTVTDTNGCTGSDFIHVTISPSPAVDLGGAARYICGGKPVVLRSPYQSGNIWSSSQGELGRTEALEMASTGKVWLTVYDNGCSASDTVMVEFTTNTVQAMFLASTMDTVNRPVKFVNLSEPLPLSQTWYFGDGNTSTGFSPVHTYVQPTDFSVTLEVSNGFCTDRLTKALSVLFRQKGGHTDQPVPALELIRMQVIPNPFSGESKLEVELNDVSRLTMQLTDICGRILLSEVQECVSMERRLLLDALPNGVYFLTVQAGGLKGTVRKTIRIVKVG